VGVVSDGYDHNDSVYASSLDYGFSGGAAQSWCYCLKALPYDLAARTCACGFV